MACLPHARPREREGGVRGRRAGRATVLGSHQRRPRSAPRPNTRSLTFSVFCIQTTRECWMALAHDCGLAAEPGLQLCVYCGKPDVAMRCSACQFPYCSGKWYAAVWLALADSPAVRGRALTARPSNLTCAGRGRITSCTASIARSGSPSTRPRPRRVDGLDLCRVVDRAVCCRLARRSITSTSRGRSRHDTRVYIFPSPLRELSAAA